MEKNSLKSFRPKDAKEACEIVLKEMGEERLVVKSKSNISKEIRLTSFLKEHGIEVIETDMGDRIGQIAGPSGFSLHRADCPSDRYEVAEILSKHSRKGGSAYS